MYFTTPRSTFEASCCHQNAELCNAIVLVKNTINIPKSWKHNREQKGYKKKKESSSVAFAEQTPFLLQGA